MRKNNDWSLGKVVRARTKLLWDTLFMHVKRSTTENRLATKLFVYFNNDIYKYIEMLKKTSRNASYGRWRLL